MHGPHARGTAEHHAIHLQEYAEKNGMVGTQVGTENLTDVHSLAYLVVEENDMAVVRDGLKPQRAEWVN